jgi:hypothetical protein
MKTSILSLFALAISAALAIPVQAGGQGHGGGGGFGFSGASGHTSFPAQAAASSFHSGPRTNFGGGHFIAPGQRFSSIGMRSPNSFRQHRFVGANHAQFGIQHQDALRMNNHGGDRIGKVGSRGSNAAPDHIFARQTANWHRDWDRGRDHWWHGRRCHFVNGSWFIYDIGFYPYDYWYPSDYYADDYYPYQYDPGVYEGGGVDYYGQGAYDSSQQYPDSVVAAGQEQLARQGYYRGEIDGIRPGNLSRDHALSKRPRVARDRHSQPGHAARFGVATGASN